MKVFSYAIIAGLSLLPMIKPRRASGDMRGFGVLL
jgi:hypothetical protein